MKLIRFFTIRVLLVIAAALTLFASASNAQVVRQTNLYIDNGFGAFSVLQSLGAGTISFPAQIGSAALTTSAGITLFTGPAATHTWTYTLPDASATLAYLSGDQTFTGGLTINGGLTLGTPLGLSSGGSAVDNTAITQNYVFAGPGTGSSAGDATFRPLVDADLPSDLGGEYIQNQSSAAQPLSSFWISGNGTIGTNLNVTGTIQNPAGTLDINTGTGNTSIGNASSSTTITGPLDATGTIQNPAGTLDINTGTGNTSIGNASGSTTITGPLDATGTIQNPAGTLDINTGTGNTSIGNASSSTTITGPLDATGTIQNPAGTLDINTGTGNTSIGNASGSTTITGPLDATGTIQNPAGTLDINTGTGNTSIGNASSSTTITGPLDATGTIQNPAGTLDINTGTGNTSIGNASGTVALGTATTGGLLQTTASTGVVSNGNLSGDVTTSGSLATTLAKIDGTTLTVTTPASSNVLYYNGSIWENHQLASSDLSDASSLATTSEVTTAIDAAVGGTTGQLAVFSGANAVDGGNLTGDVTTSGTTGTTLAKIDGTTLTVTTPASSNVLYYNGSIWENHQLASSDLSDASSLATTSEVTTAIDAAVGGTTGQLAVFSGANAVDGGNLTGDVTTSGTTGTTLAKIDGTTLTVTTPASSNVLYYNGSIWENHQLASSDLSDASSLATTSEVTTAIDAAVGGTTGQLAVFSGANAVDGGNLTGDVTTSGTTGTTLAKIDGTTLTVTTPASSNVLYYNGSIWENHQLASSDLSDASSLATTSEITTAIDAAVGGTTGQLAVFSGANAVDGGNLTGDVTTSGTTGTTLAKIDGTTLTVTTPASSNVLYYNGSIWENHQLASSDLSDASSLATTSEVTTAIDAAVGGTTGQLAVFSGANAVDGGNLTGDVTTSGTTGTTLAKIDGTTLTVTTPASSNVLYYNGSIWENHQLASSDLSDASSLATTSEVTTAIDAAVSGTTGYLAVFTAGNDVGNSQIFDNGTSVGIGTATPVSERVEIAGSATPGYHSPLKVGNSIGTGATFINYADPGISGNARYDGGAWVYDANGKATNVDLSNGELTLYTDNGDETAGDGATFIQTFAVDASGDGSFVGSVTSGTTGVGGVAGSFVLTDGTGGKTYTLKATTGGSYSPTFLLPAETSGGNPYTLATTADIPSPGNFIKNGVSQQTSASFNIDGNGTLGGTLTNAGDATLGTGASATANSFGTSGNAAAVANTIGSTFTGSTTTINGETELSNTTATGGGEVRTDYTVADATSVASTRATGNYTEAISNSGGLSYPTATGILADAEWTGGLNTTDQIVGLQGETHPGSGITALGVVGEADQTNPTDNTGVLGFAVNGGNANVGVAGTSNATEAQIVTYQGTLPAGFGAGVLGYNQASTAGQYSGYFYGLNNAAGSSTVRIQSDPGNAITPGIDEFALSNWISGTDGEGSASASPTTIRGQYNNAQSSGNNMRTEGGLFEAATNGVGLGASSDNAQATGMVGLADYDNGSNAPTTDFLVGVRGAVYTASNSTNGLNVVGENFGGSYYRSVGGYFYPSDGSDANLGVVAQIGGSDQGAWQDAAFTGINAAVVGINYNTPSSTDLAGYFGGNVVATGNITTGAAVVPGALLIHDGSSFGYIATLNDPDATNSPVFNLPAETGAGPYTLATTGDITGNFVLLTPASAQAIQATTDAIVPLTIEAHSATQSADLQDWSNSTPSVLAFIDASGDASFVGLTSSGSSTIATSGSTINTFASGGSSTNSFGSGRSSTNSFGDGGIATNTFGTGGSAINTIGSDGISMTTILGGTSVGINNSSSSSGATDIADGSGSTGSVSIGNTTGGVTITSTNWSASGAALTAGGTATAGSLVLTDGTGDNTYTLKATTGGSFSPTFLLPTEPTVGPYTLATTGDNTDFVNSINNAASDVTLTFAGTGSGPYTGAVTGKLNLDNANTWTNEVTIAPGSSHDVTSLLVEQTATASPLNAIMDVTNTGASTHYLTVDPTGNIGIGMATPSSQFSNFSTGTNIVDPYGTGGVNKTFTWVSNSGGYAATVDNSTAADMEDNGLLVKVANNRNASLALEVSSGDVGAVGTTLFDVWGNGNVTMSPSNADTISIGNNTVNTLTTITGGAAWSISDVGVGTFGQLLAGSGVSGSDQLEVAGQATITTGGTAPYALSINNTSSAAGAEDISGNHWSILENGGASFGGGIAAASGGAGPTANTVYFYGGTSNTSGSLQSNATSNGPDIWTLPDSTGTIALLSNVTGAEAAEVILLPTASSRNVIQPSVGTAIPLTVEAYSGQSVDLQDWDNSTGTPIASIDQLGDASFAGLSSTKNSTIATGASTVNSFGNGGSTHNYIGNGGSSVDSIGNGGSAINYIGRGGSAANYIGGGGSESTSIGGNAVSSSTNISGSVGINDSSNSTSDVNIENNGATGAVNIGNATGGVSITAATTITTSTGDPVALTITNTGTGEDVSAQNWTVTQPGAATFNGGITVGSGGATNAPNTIQFNNGGQGTLVSADLTDAGSQTWTLPPATGTIALQGNAGGATTDNTNAPDFSAATTSLLVSTYTSGGAVTMTIPAASTGATLTILWDKGDSTLTITPATGTILKGSSFVTPPNTQGATLVGYGTNWYVVGIY